MENQYSFTNIQPRCFTCGKYIAVKKLKYDLLIQKEKKFDIVIIPILFMNSSPENNDFLININKF